MPPKPSTSAQVLVEETKKVLKEKNVVKFHQIITKLKKKCSTKAAVLEFFQENLSCYHVLLNAMDILMSGGWKLNDSPLGTVMCKELISLIANLCHFTVTAAVELRKLNGTNFSSNSLRLLESALGFRNDSILKASLLRLLSNLADYRETCSLVTLHSSLLDKIAYMLNDTEKIIYEASIRVIKQLSRHRSCVKHVVMSNSAYYMGVRIKQLPQGDIIDDVNILSTMELLSKSTYIRDFGRQLAQSTCNEALMNILYSEIKEDKDDLLKRWKSLIVFLAKYSFQMREMFNQRVIEEVVQKGVLDKYLCSFLISFTVEPYGRSALRLGGGIDLILERMTSIKSLKEQSEIVASFKNFIHHSPGLSWICHKSQLMELCLKLMEEVLQDNVVEHKIEGEAEDQLEAAVRGEYDSRLYPYETSARKPPLPSTYRNSSYSPPQNYSPANSPLYPTSPMSMSSLSPLSSPPSSSRDHSPSPASYFGYASNDESPSTKEPEDKRITIINDCMWLYRFISHDDTQLDCLIQPNVLRGFIRYLGKSPSINDKLAHTLKCVARVRLHIANLLEIRFPYLLVFELIRRPCLSTRFARICSECAEKSRYGFEILNDFVNEVDSSFGMGVLNMQISSMEQKTHLYGLLNGLLLLKSSERRSRFSERVKPLEGIFEYLKQCLENETEKDIEENELIKDVLAVLGLLVSRRYLSKVIGKVEGTHAHEGECQLLEAEEGEPQVIFESSSGEVLKKVKKEYLKTTRGYFQGLVDHSFVENASETINFKVDLDEEEYDQKEFITFIHYLSGCRDSDCVKVDDVKTCVSLLHMADKYLCTELSEQILRTDGIARKLIDGTSFLDFLPVILSSWLYRDRFGDILSLVFLKFSTTSQQIEALKALVANSVSIQLFLDLLKSFVSNVQHTNRPAIAWDF